MSIISQTPPPRYSGTAGERRRAEALPCWAPLPHPLCFCNNPWDLCASPRVSQTLPENHRYSPTSTLCNEEMEAQNGSWSHSTLLAESRQEVSPNPQTGLLEVQRTSLKAPTNHRALLKWLSCSGLGWGPSVCISNTLSHDAEWRTTFE